VRNVLPADIPPARVNLLTTGNGANPAALGNPAMTGPIVAAPEAIVPLIDRIRSFLASPQGRRLTDQGRRYASDPRRQQQARGLLNKFRRR
jgi:hypothetical protein